MTADHRKRSHFTIMLVPHADGDVVSLRVPIILTQIAACVMAVFWVGSLVFINSYWDLLGTMDELSDLRHVTREQREQFTALTRDLAHEVEALERDLSELAHLDEQVRTLVLQEPFADLAAPIIENSQRATAGLDAYATRGESMFAAAALDSGSSDPTGTSGRGGTWSPANGSSGQPSDPALQQLIFLQGRSVELATDLARRESSLYHVRDSLSQEYSDWETTPNLWPAAGITTSQFGWRTSPMGGGAREFHSGLDIAARTGTPIMATAAGRVTYSGWRGSYGYLVSVDHGNGYETRYAHNSKNVVKVGESVEKGQLIAYVGTTGRSTGPHVHYEILRNRQYVNPVNYLEYRR